MIYNATSYDIATSADVRDSGNLFRTVYFKSEIYDRDEITTQHARSLLLAARAHGCDGVIVETAVLDLICELRAESPIWNEMGIYLPVLSADNVVVAYRKAL